MTPLHSAIKNALLGVCLETTAKHREVSEKTTTAAKVQAAVFSKFAMDNIGVSLRDYIADIMSALLGEPINDAMGSWLPMAVTVNKNHGDKIIVTHGIKMQGLFPNGKEGVYPIQNLRAATDEEVEECLDELSASQLRGIVVMPVFAPYIQGLFEESTEMVAKGLDEDPEDEES